jgi:carbamoyl-phosphate synthase large subunit
MSGENIPDSIKVKHYKELIVWQRSMSLAKAAYQLTARFPADEKFGLTALIRRTAVSIPSSIAKGQARYETREFLQHLSYADGYLAELETQLLLSLELGFCETHDIEEPLKEIDELQRMLNAIARKLISGSPLATRHSPLSSGEAKDSF